MLKIEKTEVVGWEAAIRGMRNPMNSWEKSDSQFVRDPDYGCFGVCPCAELVDCDCCHVGPNDLKLMNTLRNAGTDHRKFMRMITVYLDITAPLYWWKEFDTYKVGTVANSCSTMHKIAAKEFMLEDFSHEHLLDVTTSKDNESVYLDGIKHTSRGVLLNLIDCLNHFRKLYLKTKNKKYWWQMIQLLPSSYNQKRTIMMSYEVLANIYKSRRHHKLDEWHTLCDWIEGLPYSEMITGGADHQNSAPIKDLTITDWWNQCGHMDDIQSVKSNCDIVTDTIGKLQKKFWSQEKGDTSDTKPE